MLRDNIVLDCTKKNESKEELKNYKEAEIH